MTITTDDCKALLGADSALMAMGARDAKGWRRIGKKNGSQGVEGLFVHPGGAMAKVVENAGQIRIASAGASLAELDDPGAQRPAGGWVQPASAPELAARSPFETRMAPPGLAAKAKALAARQMEWDEEEDGDLDAKARKLDGVAWANQFIFAMGDGGEYVFISPLKYYEDEGCCYDQESPICHLLPSESDDVNGCGTWEIPFAGTPTDLAAHLMSLGFLWREDFQSFIAKDAMAVMQPVMDWRALEASTPASGSKRQASL